MQTDLTGSIYRGRFAPSPTGPLHFGSLVAAVASYLDARANDGVWLVRMEDVDTPRCVPGTDRLILETLEAFGMISGESVLYQTARTLAYQEALDRLQQMGVAYACSCSRKDTGTGLYPGTCRNGPKNPHHPLSWRVRFDDPALGDFVVRRSDGLFSYQLAVVVDDAAQQITHVVRGADLLESTPWQNHLQRLLGYTVPRYRHIPIATNEAGEKLSKQTHAEPLDATRAPELLRRALRFLEQPEAEGNTQAEILRAAARRWR
ncbi:MAG: tRNA glutamyl-Q(34) synthetase GluQRS [Bryobacteraceae bacterium]